MGFRHLKAAAFLCLFFYLPELFYVEIKRKNYELLVYIGISF
jgi:hypothetical protein